MSRLAVPTCPLDSAGIVDDSERSGPSLSLVLAFGFLALVWSGAMYLEAEARGPHFWTSRKGRRVQLSEATNRLSGELLVTVLAAGLATPLVLGLANALGLAPRTLRGKEKGIHPPREALGPVPGGAGVPEPARFPTSLAPAAEGEVAGCAPIGCGFMLLGLGLVTVWEGYLAPYPRPLFLTPWLIPVAAGLWMHYGQKAVAEVEVRVVEPPLACGETFPVLVRVVAGRAMHVSRVTLDARCMEAVLSVFRHKNSPSIGWTTTWSGGEKVRIPVDAPLERGQELRVLAAVPLPARALPTRAPSLTVFEGVVDARREVDRAAAWFLGTAIEIRGLSDALFGWKLPAVVRERPPRPAGAPAAGPAEDRAFHAAALAEGVRCPFCGDPIQGPAAVACRSCDTLHHPDCWSSTGRCTTYACGGTGSRPVRLVRAG